MPLNDIYKFCIICILMDMIKAEMDSDFMAVGFKNKRKNLRVLEQVGKTTKVVDAKRKALMPGKRISANGKVYWETRKNRSDAKGQKV